MNSYCCVCVPAQLGCDRFDSCGCDWNYGCRGQKPTQAPVVAACCGCYYSSQRPQQSEMIWPLIPSSCFQFVPHSEPPTCVFCKHGAFIVYSLPCREQQIGDGGITLVYPSNMISNRHQLFVFAASCS
jgi:hypothetical protein